MVRNQGDDPILRLKKSAFLIIVMILTILLVRSPSQTHAQFVIAGWENSDENGQGFYMITPYQNSSGSFVTIPNPDTGSGDWYPENTTVGHLNFTANTALRFDARVLVNYTLLGLGSGDIVLGRNFFRVGLYLSTAESSVFSLQNMTYDNLSGVYATGLWWYSYVDIADYILVAGQIYTVDFTLEIFN